MFISLFGYEVGVRLKKKFGWAILNPLLIAIIIVIAALKLLKIDYNTYYDGAKYLSYLLTPATVCLAVPLYQQITVLKKNWKAILAGVAWRDRNGHGRGHHHHRYSRQHFSRSGLQDLQDR